MLSTLNYALFQELNSHAGEHPWLDAIMVFCANWLIFGWLLFFLIAWGKPLSWKKHVVSDSESSSVISPLKLTVSQINCHAPKRF